MSGYCDIINIGDVKTMKDNRLFRILYYILDLPKYIYKFRIIKRFVKRKLKLETGKKETLKSLLDLLKWTDKFQDEDMKEIIKILEKYKEKVYFVKSKKEIKEILKRKLF